MKIRTGFVSNSSSSSFCIYGISDSSAEELVSQLLQNKDFCGEILQKAQERWEQNKAKWEETKPDKKFPQEKPTFASFFYQLEPAGDEDEDDYESEDSYEVLENVANALGLEHQAPPDYDMHYIGRSWSSIRDDETGKEFKDSVEKLLTQCFGQGLKFGTMEESWYDG